MWLKELILQSEFFKDKVMVRSTRNNNHDRYRSRISNLFQLYDENSDPESQAHNAKYLAVLISGYLEQSIKELLLHYASQGGNPQLSRYIEQTWPISKNMNANNIKTILHQFNTTWGDEFLTWLEESDIRKTNINSVVRWRNSIAHGQESNTTGVTLPSVRAAFSIITDLVLWIENKVAAPG